VSTVGVLIVGDEVLTGEVRDENGPWLLARLTALGSRVVRMSVVGDREPEIVRELSRLRAEADAVVVSGGIGPTHDDVTRQAVAAALGVPLEEHADAVARVRAWYGDRETPAERAMALLPRGASVLLGPKTGALGFAAAGVTVLPGVPFLLRDLLDGAADRFAGPALRREEIHTPLREGEIADDLSRIQGAALDVAIGSYPVYGPDGRWSTRVVVRSSDPLRSAAVAADVRAALSRPPPAPRP
jgi:molybdenum cofactor synthesis domain-containing protein